MPNRISDKFPTIRIVEAQDFGTAHQQLKNLVFAFETFRREVADVVNNLTISGTNAVIIVRISSADSPFSALVNHWINCDTSGGVITIDLPSGVSLGERVGVGDGTATAGTNNITVSSTNNIRGLGTDYVLSNNREGIIFEWRGGSEGWSIFIGII